MGKRGPQPGAANAGRPIASITADKSRAAWELAREHGPYAIALYAKIMRDDSTYKDVRTRKEITEDEKGIKQVITIHEEIDVPNVPTTLRLAAAEFIVDRAYGKAPQSVEVTHSGQINSRMEVIKLTMTPKEAAEIFARRAALQPDPLAIEDQREMAPELHESNSRSDEISD